MADNIPNNEKLAVESIRSYPEWSAYFLEKCAVYVQIRNKSISPIIIERVDCNFDNEAFVEPYIPSITPKFTIKPNHLSHPIRLEFKADLAFKAGTNFYQILIYYRVDNNLYVLEYDPRKFLVFSEYPGEEQVFISHKDREDTDIGRHLSHFLRKLGFIGYLSEDDRRPGIDLWKKKIPSAIESSVAIIILWTAIAAQNPENIYREIDIAKSFSKKLLMVREKDVLVPSDFPKDKDIEYFPVQRPVLTYELKEFACRIEDTYRSGGYAA